MYNKGHGYIVAFLFFIVGLVETIAIAVTVSNQNIPLMSIGVWVISAIPVTMFILCVVTLVKVAKSSNQW